MTNASAIPAASMEPAISHGSVTVMKDGVASFAIKVLFLFFNSMIHPSVIK